MLTFSIDPKDNGFDIKYNFTYMGTYGSSITLTFNYGSINSFNYKNIHHFVNNTIQQLNFTDNIYYLKNDNIIKLVYYTDCEYNYSEDETKKILNTLQESLHEIDNIKLKIAFNILIYNYYIKNIDTNFDYIINYPEKNKILEVKYNQKSLLYYSIKDKQYKLAYWLLDNGINIELCDLEFANNDCITKIYMSKQCSMNVKNFIIQQYLIN